MDITFMGYIAIFLIGAGIIAIMLSKENCFGRRYSD
jgi:hypothetical protein